MGKTGVVVTGLVAIALFVGAVIVIGDEDQKTQPSSSTPNTQQTESEIVITYSDSGFSPASLTVKSGDSVTLKNTSSDSLQVQSNPHPVHTDNDELNIGVIEAGQIETFTVTTKGTFGYHNHLNTSQTGTIIVQ